MMLGFLKDFREVQFFLIIIGHKTVVCCCVYVFTDVILVLVKHHKFFGLNSVFIYHCHWYLTVDHEPKVLLVIVNISD